jgi:hemerythrin-like domain-containing protein
MERATNNLETDHMYILRLIEVMEKITHTPTPNAVHLDSVVEVIKNFVDGFHHAKEEKLLFPLMVEKGFSMQQGPIPVMVNEHVQGRDFVKGMEKGIESFKGGNAAVKSMISENMQGYCSLLRNHISKENNVLFKMADNVLSEDDHLLLMKEFEKVEQSNFCGGMLKDYIVTIESLESAYGL